MIVTGSAYALDSRRAALVAFLLRASAAHSSVVIAQHDVVLGRREVEQAFDRDHRTCAEIARDMDRYRALTRERSEVEPVVGRFREFERAESDVSAASEMALS